MKKALFFGAGMVAMILLVMGATLYPPSGGSGGGGSVSNAATLTSGQFVIGGGGGAISSYAGTVHTNGEASAATFSNSVSVIDGANAKVVISNGVIGTVKAITNSGNLETATLDTTGAGNVVGAFDVGIKANSRSASFPSGGNSAIHLGDVDGAFNTTTLTIDDSAQAVTLSAAGTFIGNGSGLTSLNAANISSGTLNNARLNSNILTNIIGGASFQLAGWNATGVFVSPMGGTNSATEAVAAMRFTVAISIRDLDVNWIGVGNNTNAVATVMTNGTASNITCNANGTGSASAPINASDTTHEVVLPAGQNLSIRFTGNNASVAATAVSAVFSLRYHY